LIKLNNVSFSYQPGKPVFHDVDFEIRKGQRIALLGANGSGKSTLLHIITGLLRPVSGEIEAFGGVRKQEGDFHEVRARVGLLFQDPEDQLFCPTVLEDIAFGPLNLGKTVGETNAIVKETLQMLGLGEYEERITYKLSAGEKRLVSIATVLAMKPDVLLLDEPLSGLDQETQERITEIITMLPQTMLIVSHNQQFLSQVTNRTVCLQNGALIAKTSSFDRFHQLKADS